VKILFVKLGAIGDIVHTLPALAAVRRAFPGSVIDWVVEERSAEILRRNPLIDELIEVNTRSIRETRSPEKLLIEIWRQAGSLRTRGYDVAVDLQGLLKSATIAKISGAQRRVGFEKTNLREPAARLMYTEKIAVPQGVNVIDKNLGLVRGALSIEPSIGGYEFPIQTGPEHRLEADVIAAKTGGRFAVLNPAGGWVTKLWPAENYGKLAERLWNEYGIASVVATGPRETELAERVRESAGNANVTLAEPSLKGFYELAKRAAVYVGGDTGPTHIAVAAGAPVVGIFGPTEWWRNGSPRVEDINVGREDIGCRVDCHRRTCSKWICMEISVDDVFAAAACRIKIAEVTADQEAVA
jgi:heptosyltransferase I